MQQLLTILALVLSAALPANAPEGAIEDYIAQEMPAAGVPGLTYAVVDNGEITTVGAQGVLRIGNQQEVTPNTAFLSGSISKSFTALAVMQLVEAGQANLDTELSHYLDGFSGRPSGAITIRQLLSHTSGFSTLQGNASRTDTTGEKDELARRVGQLEELTPDNEPEQSWEYSNTNYEILGRLIEVVSGQEFQSYVAANILEPVGMQDSFVADGEIHEAMATGHRPWFGSKLPLADNMTDRGTAPQGGIVASAIDLARYMQMMMNGEDDVLRADNKELMMRAASEISPFYGLGWFVESSKGTVSHSGASPGFESLATMIPAEKKAVVVLVNGGSGIGFGETAQLLNGITAKALDLEYDGEGSRWPQKALFVGLVLLPLIYVFSMVWAWLHRTRLHAKSNAGIPGLFSLWFPLLPTLVAAWVILTLVPSLFGVPISTLHLFQPDVTLLFVASAVTGVLWACVKIGVAYAGTSSQA